MDGMRTLLIIVGFLVILAALGHGLWTIRKNNKAKKHISNKQINSTARSRQEVKNTMGDDNFDEYGIGAVRTIKTANSAPKATATPTPAKASAKPLATVQQPALFDEEEPPAVGRSNKGFQRKEPSMEIEQLPMAFGDNENTKEPNISSTDFASQDQKPTPDIGAIEPDPITKPKAAAGTAAATEQGGNAREQLPKHEPVVITLFVSGDIQGAILLQTVTELGFKFGDMDIFHRHADTAGKGPTLFSLANMFNPGVFNLDEIETFTTRGVALFMELPVASDGHKAFTMMYNAANKIAEAMPRAAVLDGNRNPITKQAVQHTYQKIREFERRQHVADAARH